MFPFLLIAAEMADPNDVAVGTIPFGNLNRSLSVERTRVAVGRIVHRGVKNGRCSRVCGRGSGPRGLLPRNSGGGYVARSAVDARDTDGGQYDCCSVRRALGKDEWTTRVVHPKIRPVCRPRGL